MRKQCIQVKGDGSRCRSTAVLKDGQKCWFHSSQVQESQRQAARSRGGKSRKYLIVSKGNNPSLTSHLRDVLIRTIDGILSGSIQPMAANSVAYCCSVLYKVAEAEEIEGRLRELEQFVESRKV